MIYLIVVLFRLMWFLLVASVWLCWALVALTAMLIASASGHQGAARSWQRSMRWGRFLL